MIVQAYKIANFQKFIIEDKKFQWLQITIIRILGGFQCGDWEPSNLFMGVNNK
jgi:hypothetical protein